MTVKYFLLRFLPVFFFFLFCVTSNVFAGTLACSVIPAAECTGTVVYRMSNSTNAHVELPSQATASYADNVVCCTGVTDLGTSCAGTYATVLKISAVTNGHGEQNDQNNYPHDVCLQAPVGGSISIGYQAAHCGGFDTTLGSLSGTSNAHVGNSTAYNTKICASASAPQSLTFNISDNTIGFGALVAGAARYASSTSQGSPTDTEDAHIISASTNASGGYTITLNGTTLTCAECGGQTITAVGGVATASSAGTEQFGVRMIKNSGSGAVSAPYNGVTWALDTAAFPDTIATGDGDGVTSVFGVRYLSNIAANTEAGSYNAVLTYSVTGSF